MRSIKIDLERPFRLAEPDDVPEILPLAKSTVPGFVENLWSRLADEGESADDFGYRAQSAFVSEGQTIVADVHGTIEAMLISYPMADSPNPHVPGMDDTLRPLMKLFGKASGTWYLHGISCTPGIAGHGIGSRLMHVAEDLGREARKSMISLLVIDTNIHAIRFYEKRGYTTTASEAIVRKGWDTSAREWLLMEKPLA